MTRKLLFRSRFGLVGLSLLILFGGCLEFLETREPFPGDPTKDAMVVVTGAHLKWTHDRTLVSDKVHWLGYIECHLKGNDGGTVLVRKPMWPDKSTRTFVFSDIPPGEYRVETLIVEQEIRAPGPDDAFGSYETHGCTFPKVQFPELTVNVEAGEIAFVGNIYLEVKHSGWGSYKVNRNDEDAKFTVDWDSEADLLKPVAKAHHPDSPWTARLQEHINAIESGRGR